MPDLSPPPLRGTQNLTVFQAGDFVVASGVNAGDGLGFADDLSLDDVYLLERGAGPVTLSISGRGADILTVAPGSPSGTQGADLHIDCTVMFMSPDGDMVEGLVLVEVQNGAATEVFLLPLTHLAEKVEYTLVGVDTNKAKRKFAEAACVSFTRGTRITMASGAQCSIEDLKVSDRVLTRDDGPQEVRWIGQNTVRAIGDFAPILIRKGTLNNENDLLVSPDHRLFIYQRDDTIGAGRSEILVKVRHLINGDTVTRENGGFVDYFQLLFDSHQIIYAEGIAAESLLIDNRTRPALPDDVDEALAKSLPGHSDRHHLDYEVRDGLLSGPDAAARLRRSSTR